MKNICKVFSIIIFTLFFTGCVKNEFDIKFELAPSINGPYRVVYYASDKEKGWIIETVSDVNQGRGLLHGATRYPSVVYIFSPVSSGIRCVLYVERGDKITLTGSEADPILWEVKGNALSEECSQWRLENKAVLISSDPAEINKAVASYVKKNPESKLSTFLLSVYYSRVENEKEYLALRASLQPKALDNEELMRALSMADMPDGLLTSPAAGRAFTITGANGDPCKLNPKSDKASLLAFRDEDGNFFRSETYDSLKAISRAYQDSAKRLIADLYLGPDSALWIRSVRMDTIKNVVRGWMPRGLADSVSMAMGVRRLPYFIVLDNKGEQVYRGDHLGKASEAFHRLMK